MFSVMGIAGIAAKAIVVFVFAALLLCGLLIYSKHSKSKEPLMRESCNGDCAGCSRNCEDKKGREE